MSAQEMLLEEIKRQPEAVLREVLHYLKFLARQRADEEWADVLPSREVEQEVLDIIDRKWLRATAKSGSWTWAWPRKRALPRF